MAPSAYLGMQDVGSPELNLVNVRRLLRIRVSNFQGRMVV